jgi:Leucine Rich Repeat.
LSKLVYLRLDFLGIESINKDVFTGLVRLEVLELTGQEIRSLDNDVFGEITNLVELNLYRNKIETIGERAFNGLSKLKKLNLDDNRLKLFNNYNKIFVPVSNIIQLNVDSNLISDETNLLKYFPLLKTLSIKGNVTKNLVETASSLQLEFLTIQDSLSKIYINYFKNFKKLRGLELEYSLIQFIAPGEFCSHPKLTKLAITFGHLTIIQPGAFYGLKQLKELHLHRNPLNEIKEGVFGRVSEECSNLIRNNYSIESECVMQKGLVELEVLSITYGNISHIHPNAFCGNINLKTLNLMFNSIVTLEYKIEVRKSVYEDASVLRELHNLRDLNVYRNRISNLSVGIFKNNQHLKISQ